MKVRVEDKGSCRKIVHVEVPSDAVVGEYESVVNAFAKAARIPGFRPGKAPRNVVEKHYEKKISEETRDRLLPDLYRKAVDDKKVDTVNIIDVGHVEFVKDRGMNFSVTVDVVPEFKLPKYKKISLKKNKIEVKDSDVDNTLNRILENFSKFEDVKGRSVKRDDLVMVDYTSICDGKSVETIAAGSAGIGEGHDFWMMVSEPELVPGFCSGIEGADIGSTREIKVHFPDDYRVTVLGGKDAVYTVTVKNIREKVLPKLDDDLLKRFEVKSEAELRDKIRADLQKEQEQMEQVRLKNEITKYLLEKVDFSLPQSIVEHETELIARNMQERLAMQGGTKVQIEKERVNIIESARKNAEERVRVSYILQSIADEEKVEVSEDNMKERLQNMAARYGMTAAQLRSELQKRDALNNVKSEIRSDKTLDLLLEYAKIK